MYQGSPSPLRRYGRAPLGAAAAASYNYAKRAEELAHASFSSGNKYAVVRMELGGRNAIAQGFDGSDDATTAFEQAMNYPGKDVYIGLYEPDGVMSEHYYGAAEVIEESWRSRIKSLAPVVVGVSLAIGAVLYFTQEKSGKRRARRRRR